MASRSRQGAAESKPTPAWQGRRSPAASGPAAEPAEQAGGRRLPLPVLACQVCGESPESHDAGLSCSPEGRWLSLGAMP